MTSNVLHLIATIPVDLFRLYRIGFQHKLPNRIDFFRKTTSFTSIMYESDTRN